MAGCATEEHGEERVQVCGKAEGGGGHVEADSRTGEPQEKSYMGLAGTGTRVRAQLSPADGVKGRQGV